MNKVRKTKELDHYLKNIINKVPDKIENFINNKDGEFSMTYYEGNWAKDVYDNFTEIQAGKIFKRMEKFRDKAKLIQKGPQLKEVIEIGKRIEVAVSTFFKSKGQEDPTRNFGWDYVLVDNDKVVNAWCMPGGKIAVYTGILDVTKNKNGLAAVMGHEIAHAVAKHSVERASRGVLLKTGTSLINIATGGKLSEINRATGMDTVGLLSSIGIMNPFNRKQETEADYLGMIFASLSGYDIRETVKVWERMKEANKGKEPPEFMSTHPSSTNRINNITEWIGEIIIKYPPIT
mgnify:CR=1 FL=1